MFLLVRLSLISISLVTGLAQAWPLGVSAEPTQLFENKNSKSNFCPHLLDSKIFSKTELYFGLSKPDGSNVTEEEWKVFLNNIVTPLWTEGLTVLSAQGQFLDATGKINKENSKVLILVYYFTEAQSQKVEQIREKYKYYFQQESVLRLDQQSCTSF